MPTDVSLDTRAAAAHPPGRPARLPRVLLLAGAGLAGVTFGLIFVGGPGGGSPPMASNNAGVAAGLDEQTDDEGPITELPVSGVLGGEGGARTGPGGIPAGFGHTRDGAVAAATVYLAALSSSGMYRADVRGEVLDAVAEPAWRSAEQDPIDAAVGAEGEALGLDTAGEPPAGSVVLATVRPTWGAFRVAAYTPVAAEVVLWYYSERSVLPVGAATPPPGEWRTTVLHLKWTGGEGGDWKVSALPSHQPGPTPGGAPRSAPPIEERARLLGAAWELYANTDI